MYDPSVGRWFTEDPIEFEGGDADLYRYVANDPTNATDPSGLKLVVAKTDVTVGSDIWKKILDPIKDGNQHLKDGLGAAIELIDTMIQSPVEKKAYQYNTVDDLVNEIKLRLYVIATAKAYDSRAKDGGLAFPADDGAVCAFQGSKMWEAAKVKMNINGLERELTGIKLIRGSSASEAIGALYEAKKDSPLVADCASTVGICLITALRAYLKPDAFAGLFKDKPLAIAGPYGLNRFLTLPKEGEEQDLLPGDTRVFSSPGAKSAAYRFENTIYLGESNYYAPGIGIKSFRDLKSWLADRSRSSTGEVNPAKSYGKIIVP